jgi:hypothetical protein
MAASDTLRGASVVVLELISGCGPGFAERSVVE